MSARFGNARVLLLTLIARGLIDMRPGEVTHLQTFHDDDCPYLRTGIDIRDCSCDPEITIRGTTYRYSEVTAAHGKGAA